MNDYRSVRSQWTLYTCVMLFLAGRQRILGREVIIMETIDTPGLSDLLDLVCSLTVDASLFNLVNWL
jgi:hypothetical protein